MVKIRDFESTQSGSEENDEEMSDSFDEEPEAVRYSYQDGVEIAKAAAAQKIKEVLDSVLNFSIEPVIKENHRLNRIIAKEKDAHNVTIDEYNALLEEQNGLLYKNNGLLNENEVLLYENKSYQRQIGILRTKIHQLEAEKQTSSSFQGPQPTSSSSHSSEKEKTVVEAEKANERSKEESSAQKTAALEQLGPEPASSSTVKAIPRIDSKVAAAKKAQVSTEDDKSGSKEEEPVTSNQEKRAASIHLELRSKSSMKRPNCRSRSRRNCTQRYPLRGARNIQPKGKTHFKAKQDAPMFTERSKRGAFIKSSQKTAEQLRK